jgi:mannitol/fructose-specific phosphotransferase system IIA component (Ntr-type)
MSILELEKMNTTQKFIALEELWQDLSQNLEDERLSPDWHLDILEQREQKIQTGDAKFYTIEEVKEQFKSFE